MNLYTELEAKDKLCPELKSKCVGTDCMLFTKHYRVTYPCSAKFSVPVSIATGKFYCGLSKK